MSQDPRTIQYQTITPPLEGLDKIMSKYQQQQQQQQWLGMAQQQTQAGTTRTPFTESEYVVIGLKNTFGEPEIETARDAAEMQRIVEELRQRGSILDIMVFKRMLRMKAKTEWETVEADV